MSQEDYPVRPYPLWSQDETVRWLNAGHTFGAHLMEFVRDPALREIPADASDEARAIAIRAIDIAIHGFLALVDGIPDPTIGDEHRATYVLSMQVPKPDGSVETIELAPDGDGLCIGYWGWIQGEFGQELPF